MSMQRWRRTRGERRWPVFEDRVGLDRFETMDFRRTVSRDGAATVEFQMMFVVDTAEGQRARVRGGTSDGCAMVSL